MDTNALYLVPCASAISQRIVAHQLVATLESVHPPNALHVPSPLQELCDLDLDQLQHSFHSACLAVAHSLHIRLHHHKRKPLEHLAVERVPVVHLLLQPIGGAVARHNGFESARMEYCT